MLCDFYSAKSLEGFGSNNDLTASKLKGSGREYSKKKASKRLALYKRETGNPTSSHFNGGNFDRGLGAVENCGSQQLLKQVIWVSNPQSASILSYNTATALEWIWIIDLIVAFYTHVHVVHGRQILSVQVAKADLGA